MPQEVMCQRQAGGIHHEVFWDGNSRNQVLREFRKEKPSYCIEDIRPALSKTIHSWRGRKRMYKVTYRSKQ